jgi:precorrin-6B methylase 2
MAGVEVRVVRNDQATMIRSPSRSLMLAQHRVKLLVKPLLIPDETKPRTIKGGPGRGTVALLNRRHDLQRELGLYESELNSIYRSSISSDSVVYDIGAGDGVTTLLYASLARDGHVYAFEPEPSAVRRLRANLDLNPTIAARIELIAAPFGPDAVTADLEPPDFLKIDIDGGELAALQVAVPLVRNFPPLVVETHSRELERGCTEFLQELGYTVEIVPNSRWRSLWPEWRPLEHNRWLVATNRRS